MKGHQLSCSLHAKVNLHQLPINAYLRSWMVGCKQTLENTVGAIKNGQSRETVNRGYKTKTNKPKTQQNMCLAPLYAQNTNNVNKTNVYYILSYYFECLINELGINSNTSSNTTYKPTSFDKDEILANHRSFMTSLSSPSGKESEDLPYLYWIPKLHKTPYKERYIAGSSTCSTKELSIHCLQ